MKVQEYKTATGNSVLNLDKEINRLIKEGFQPLGNAYSIGSTLDGVLTCQPMVKYQKD
jgi:hypothetical protein